PVVVHPGVPYNTVIPVAEGAAYDVAVTGDDDLDVGASGTRDCEQAGLASTVLDCAEGGVVVTLTNTGELPAAVTVDGDVVVIPAGGETSVVVPVAENATYDFDIVIDGSTSTITGERDCEQPGLVSALVECAEGGVVVVLSNTGIRDTTVTVDGDEVVVPAGGTAEVLVPVAENAAYDFTVEGDELSEQVSGTLDCEIPQVESIQIECAEGGVVVVITNDGDLPTTVTVDGIDHEIPAGETVEILVEIEENEDYSFTVEGDGIEQIVEGTYDCDLPEPSVDDDVVCAVGGLGVILRNTGDDTATFVITSPALADGSTEAVLEAGDTQTVLIPVAEDASTEVVVTSGGETLLDDTLTRDCEQVEGSENNPPTEVEGTTTLPRTGSDARSLLALAGALLLAGAALAFGGRRQVELA
ncbi:MAG: LPXTG cell wall anchor domain-containing protein, partial [Acidimicrobiales bacterium]